MDALSDVLKVARLSGGVFMQAEFTAPWCVKIHATPEFSVKFLGPAAHFIPYHYVAEGEVYASVEGGEAFLLRQGDAVLFPRNDAHLMGSDVKLPAVRGREIMKPPVNGSLYSIRHGGGGVAARLVCGYLGCHSAPGSPGGNPVIATLPAALRFSTKDAGPADWIRATFHFAANEVAAGRPGSETVLAKLSELLFVEAVRRYVENLPAGQTGWLAGLGDPAVARALALLHGDAARAWSVDELGREVGLSRSALADRFTRLIGLAPMQYLAQWRMQSAAQKLKDTSASLAQVAAMVGYESEASFSRAFKKAFGSAPATWRRSVTQA